MILKGVQLPTDQTGKITGAVYFPDPDKAVDSNYIAQYIYVPATLIADRSGNEIGYELLSALTSLNEKLDRMIELQELQLNWMED